MKTGGYQILDFSGFPITTGTPVTVPGVYDKIEGTHKVCLVSGVVLDTVECHDAFVTPVVNASDFTFSAYGKNWKIAANDEVTASNPEA